MFCAEQVIEGLERSVMGMKKGEVALITISPKYAFCSSESKQELAIVPPNSTVCYEVELVSFIKVSIYFLNVLSFFIKKLIWVLNDHRLHLNRCRRKSLGT